MYGKISGRKIPSDSTFLIIHNSLIAIRDKLMIRNDVKDSH